jgi:putative holliday junction resolvase
MPVLDILELPAALPPRTPVMGLDPGEKTIGVAVSDLTLSIASPLALIRRTKFTEEAKTLFALMAERGAGGVVIGLPRNMDGTEGARCQSNRALGRNLLRLRPELAVVFWDERLSTAAVERMLV